MALIERKRFSRSLLAVLAVMTAQPGLRDELQRPRPAVVSPRLVEAYGRLPLAFEENRGQTDGRVRFLSRGQGYALFLTPTELVLSLPQPSPKQEANHAQMKRGRPPVAPPATVLRMHLAGASPSPAIRGISELPGKSNYFIGSDKGRWKTGVRQYEEVLYEGVYPGIDVKYYGNQGQLEHDFIVKPGADVGQILFGVDGAESTKLNDRGDLVFQAHGNEVIQRAPIVYQDVGGTRQPVEASYELRGDHVGFVVGSYDRTRPLVIDPVLAYSTYLGGWLNDEGWGIAVDGSGNTYVTGVAYSSDFPTLNPIQGSLAGGIGDVFVTKLNAAGSALVYSTYLGGSGEEVGRGIAVDASGNAYLTGDTSSTDFPTTNPLQGAHAGGLEDAFVTKLNAAGSALVYSTYLGGSDGDYGQGIAADASGNAYVTGFTLSTNFPVANAFQPANAPSPWGFSTRDAFVTKLNATGSAFVYSTYLGGNSEDDGHGIAVDASGSAYVTGSTWSTNFPTASPRQGTNAGASDAFVTKLNAAGSSLAYSTYLGGFGIDSGQGIAVDPSGSAYVTGWTSSTAFPTANPLQAARGSCAGGGGCDDAFVSKLNPAGSSLVYSTYLGSAGVAVLAATPIVVNAGATDVVTFGGITFVSPTPGAGTALTFTTGGGLNLERCVFHGWNTGLLVQSAGKLNLVDTVVRDNAMAGISLSAGTASMERSRLTGNGTGLQVLSGAEAAIKESVVAGNGVGLDNAGSMLDVEDSVVTNNTSAGISGSAGTTRVSGSTLTNNLVGILQVGSGVVQSRGGNTIEGNGTNTSGTIGSYPVK